MDGTRVPAKLPTAQQRENDLIKTVKLLTCSDKYLGKKALPLMARHVFVEVLQGLGIKVAFADGEADKVVAAMAKMHGCCALSKDSDFFVFDLPAGYIPVDNLDIARNGTVTAKRFARARFLADLKLNVAMFPLLASAIGNDYVPVSLLRPFHVSLGDLGEVDFPEAWDMGDKEPSVRDQLIVRVAAFLAAHPSEEAAIAAIVKAADEQFKADEAAAAAEAADGETKEDEADKAAGEPFTAEALKQALEESVAGYRLDPKQASATGQTTELTTAAKCGMDPKLVGLFREGKVDAKVMDVLCYKLFWCAGLVEDVDVPSSWLASRPIRQQMYAVLLEGSAAEVTEYLRLPNEELGKSTFEPQSVPVCAVKLGFSAILKGAADAKARADFLYETVGKPAEGVPAHLLLASACIRYWIKAVGDVTAVELAAIAASLLQSKEDQALRVSKEARPNWLSLVLVSRLASLQGILLSTNLLNQCLANPVPPMSATAVYDGEFIHRFHHLQQRAKGMTALEDQLRKDKIDAKAFHALYCALAAGMQIKGEIAESFEGGIMWGVSGPEGDSTGPAQAVDKAKALNDNVAAGGLFGELLEEDGDDDDEEEAAAPAVVVDYSAAEKAAAAKKNKGKAIDEELAKAMADMEATDAKREEQARKERERKNAQKKKK